jgi:transmembrane sensor
MTAVVILGVVATHSTITGRFTRPSALPSRVYATGIGQTAQVTLADGSHVTIAPQSRLTIGRGFGRTTRTVLLTGEAYFDVSHSAGTPFLIQTGSISTRVLGTAFDIRYYPTDTAVRIAVLSGRVVASGAHATAHLTAGLIGHVTDSTATTMNGDVSATADWRAGRLTFDGTSVATVLASVGRWYGYEFIVTDSTLARRKVMATFRINEPEKTFAAIEYLLNVTMTFDRTKVIVRSRQPRGADPARRDTALLYSTPSEVGK